MQTIQLNGQNAIVTGAGRGLGKEIALTLADAGANVWIADINGDDARAVAEEIMASGVKSGYTVVDVSSQDRMLAMIDEAADTLGGLDIMCNNAGIISMMTFDTLKQDELEKLLKINVCGVCYGCEGALRKMIAGGKGGKIVNIASNAGRRGTIRAFYNLSKAAVINLGISAAVVGAPHNIRVNTVNPGIIHTPMWDKILNVITEESGDDRDKVWEKDTLTRIPLGRAQTEKDIARAVLFLVSDYADSITGQAINVDGGMVCY